MTAKRGRPSLLSRPLTSTEKSTCLRTRAKLLDRVMETFGYWPARIYIDERQMRALHLLDIERGGPGAAERDGTDSLSLHVFNALRDYLAKELVEIDDSTPTGAGLVKIRADLPRASCHPAAQLGAKAGFAKWFQETFQSETAGQAAVERDAA